MEVPVIPYEGDCGFDAREKVLLPQLADGKLDASPLITGKVGLAGVAGAFEALGDPEKHAKILIDPHSAAELV